MKEYKSIKVEKVDNVWVNPEGIFISWDILEDMTEAYKNKIDNYTLSEAPQSKIDYHRGQSAVYESILSYKDKISETNKF